MEDAGQRLRHARERLDLKFRDVEQASLLIAEKHGNSEFAVLISRLSDIENQGNIPSMFRLYSLCCIYRLDLIEVLEWYGVPVSRLTADAGMIQIEKTHAINFNPEAGAEAMLPIALNPGIDLRRTFFLSEMVQRWGKLPLALLAGADVRRFRYGFVGTEDWACTRLFRPDRCWSSTTRNAKFRPEAGAASANVPSTSWNIAMATIAAGAA